MCHKTGTQLGMGAMHDQNHLLRRKAVYYYRRRVPSDLIEVAGKDVIQFSLKTREKSEAKRLCRLEDVRWDQKFEALRRGGEQQVHTVSSVRHAGLVSLIQDYVSKADAEYGIVEPSGVPAERHDQMLEVRQMIALLEDPASEQAKERIGLLVDRLLVENHLVNKLDQDRFTDFWHLSRRALLELYRRDKARLESDFSQQSFDVLFGGKGSETTDQPSLQFAHLADDYLAEYRKTAVAKRIDQKRLNKVAASVAVIKHLVGRERSLQEINYDACRAFRNTLAEVPTNAAKHYPGLPLQEAISAAKKDGGRTLAFETQQHHLGVLRSILAHAVRKGLISANPAEGLSPLAPKPAAKDRRRAFTVEELNAIFAAPIFTGCKDDERGYATPGVNVLKRARFWAPLIALFSGMRANEIAQLRTDDIQQSERGTWFIRVTDKGLDQRVKNAASRRVVPVHSHLRGLGFLSFVEEKRAKGSDRLFPELPLDGQGYFSTRLTR